MFVCLFGVQNIHGWKQMEDQQVYAAAFFFHVVRVDTYERSCSGAHKNPVKPEFVEKQHLARFLHYLSKPLTSLWSQLLVSLIRISRNKI